jgi:hypothetical protein
VGRLCFKLGSAMRRVLYFLLTVAAMATLLPAQQPEDADARAVAQLEMQRYQILRQHLDRTLDDNVKEALTDLARRRRAIDGKYQAHSGSGLTWYQFNERVRPLVAAQVGPTWNDLMLERFPRPERVRQDYPDDVRYAAALLVLGYEFSLGRTIRPPVPPALAERDALYTQAHAAAEAPYRAHGEDSPQWGRFERDQLALSRSAEFKREVLGRYVPLFASFVADDPPPPPRPAVPAYREWLFEPLWGDEFDGAPLRFEVVRRIPDVALLLTPLWILWQARWAGRRHNARTGSSSTRASLTLPPELQNPKFPSGLRLELRIETAQVLDTQVWSETSVSWQSRSGAPGQAPTVSVQTHVTRKERLWVETMDGRQEAWTFSGGAFEAMRGHVVSWVQYVRRDGALQPVLFYNHATDCHYESDWWPTLHGHALFSWLTLMLLWVGPWALVAQWLAMEAGLRVSVWTASPLLLAGACFGLTVMARLWVHGRRRRTWKQQHRKRLLALLERFSRGLRQSSGAPDQPVA